MGPQLGSLFATATVLLPPSSKNRQLLGFPSCSRFYGRRFDIFAVAAMLEKDVLFSCLHVNEKSNCRFARDHFRSKAFGKIHAISSSLEESSLTDLKVSADDETLEPEELIEDLHKKPLTRDQLQALLVDSERAKLLHKLSEANQQNRFLKRQLHAKEEALVDFKRDLSSIEMEIQVLVKMAEEISQYGIPEGSRRVDGKFIQSHLVSRLGAVHEKITEKVKGVEVAQSREVSVKWHGMAESVVVMGTFDGWSQGEHLSKDYDGSANNFSATLLLPRGRHEIKFMVDGEWQLSPEYPSVGDGLTRNNLLIVD